MTRSEWIERAMDLSDDCARCYHRFMSAPDGTQEEALADDESWAARRVLEMHLKTVPV